MELYTPAKRRLASFWTRVDAANRMGAGWSIYVPPAKETEEK
jgi:hypothetical protein